MLAGPTRPNARAARGSPHPRGHGRTVRSAVRTASTRAANTSARAAHSSTVIVSPSTQIAPF
jgi:hypothetical protein